MTRDIMYRKAQCADALKLSVLYKQVYIQIYGIGQKLEKTVHSKGVKEMWLWVLASNNRAIVFYDRQGYQHIGDASFQMETNKYENKVMLKQFA